MNGVEIVRDEVFKHGADLNEDSVRHLLWNETGWPCFWDIGKDGDTPEECLRNQVRKFLKGRSSSLA